MTKAERDHMNSVARLGCIICGSFAELHHLRHDPKDGRHFGLGQKATNFQVIPLCARHHRTGGEGIAYHAGPRTWEANHGTEVALWRLVQTLIGEAA